MNLRTRNILTVAIPALLFTAFVVLATVTDDNDSELDAIATTTTEVTLPRVTTSLPTTTVFVPTTQVTVFPVITPTTARTTATTARRTTATTARRTSTTRQSSTATTTTAVQSGPNGRATEASDNSAAFTHNSDGTTSESATPMPTNSGAIAFKITTKVLSASGSSAQVRFVVDLTNQRGKRVTFPDGLHITLLVTPSNGSSFALVLDAHEVTAFDNGETLTAATTAPIEGFGQFSVTGSVEVDYGA